jgi:hypothetical protein
MSTPCSGSLTLFLKAQEPLSVGIPLYIKVDDATYNSLSLYLKNEYQAIQRGLKLYTKNTDGITDGATNFGAGIPLFIARDTEAIDGGLSLYLRVIEGDVNSYIPLFVKCVSGEAPNIPNGSLNLFLYNTQGSGYNNLNLYTHGF